MNASPTNASPISADTFRARPVFWAPHPVEMAIIALLTTLAHFVLREPVGEALWLAGIAFCLLPRAEIWDFNGDRQWSRIVLRWPSVTEVTLVGIAAFRFHRSGQSLWLTAAQVAGFLLLARLLAALADVVVARYPLGARAGRMVNWFCALVAFALVAQMLWTTNWSEIEFSRPNFDAIRNYRLDLRGATGVLWMGMVTVLFVGPPLELWNRALKPFDKRGDLMISHRVGVASAYIAACCIWWALLVLAIYAICSQPNLWR